MTPRQLRIRTTVRCAFWLIMGLILSLVLALTGAPGNASTLTPHTWHASQHLIHERHIEAVSWDGRTSYSEKTEACVETFNGTKRTIRLERYRWSIGPGVYIKWCSDRRGDAHAVQHNSAHLKVHGAYGLRQTWKDAQAVLQLGRVNVPWDGRFQYTQRDHQHGMCIETFNGTKHDINQYGHGVPPGFYVKFCQDGHYYVNDGKRFHYMDSM